MKKTLLILGSLLLSNILFCQSDKDQIHNLLSTYINSSSYNYPDSISMISYEKADFFLTHSTRKLWVVSPKEYGDFYKNKTRGEFNGRIGHILFIEVENDIAWAKVEILLPHVELRFIDLFLLKKLDEGWRIISKAATRKPFKSSSPKLNPIKETVMEGFLHPWSMAFINENEALLSEKDGNLLKVDLSKKEKTIIKGFPNDLVDSIRVRSRGDNSGIFEVLIDPDFQNNQFIYVSYAAENQIGMTTKVIRAKLNNNTLTDIKILLEAAPYTREMFHYGGGMTFGKDGMLYITIGERYFREIDQPELPTAQDITDRRGKIYRINSDGSIPKDNPDFGKNAIPGLYALGIRAAQGITVEPQTGNIWFSEHGTIQGDEINLLKAGANYGWPIKTTGKYRSKDFNPPNMEDTKFTDPIWYWMQTVAPTGLTFYNGYDFPQWRNNLIVPGLSRGSLWRFKVEGEKITSAEELFVHDRVRSRKVVQSPRGKLYLLTDEKNGKIIRIKNMLKP